MIKFTVPVPPSINHCYWYRNGRKYRTTQAKNYCDEVIYIVRNIMHKQKFKKFEDGKKIVCEMIYYFPDARRRDSHNTFKILLDAIEEAGLYTDDRYILIHVKDIAVDKKNPRVELTFRYQ